MLYMNSYLQEIIVIQYRLRKDDKMKTLSESILTELDRSNIMSDQNVIDICNSYSSRKNHLKYKIEGNSAVFEDGTTIKFIVNDDSEIEYYFINSQGDASKSAPVYDLSLLDLVTEEPINESATDSSSYYQKIMDKIYNAKNNLKEEEFKNLLEKVINECKNLK